MAIKELTNEQIQDTFNDHESRITQNTDSANRLADTVTDLEKKVRTVLAQVIAGCNTALINAEKISESYKTGKPEGYR